MFVASHSGGLGIAVNEMQRSINGAVLGGPSRHVRRRRSLGDVPNDFEAAIDLQYTPVRQGWYYGYPSTGGGYESVPRCPNGLGDDTTTQELTAIQLLARAQKAQAIMQIVSTASIAILATLAIMRAVKVAHNGGSRLLGDEDYDDEM
jgi:hypothetical protein